MTQTIKLLSLLTLSAAAMLAADYFPLENGNTWVYREARTGQTLEVRVGTPAITNDKVYYTLRGFLPKPALVRVNEYGNLVYWDEEREMDLIVTPFERGPVGEFEVHGRQCAAWARLSKDVAYEGPAGRWTAAQIDFAPYGCADAGELTERYVDNVGMVQRVVSTIAGPRTFDLVYAQVGRQTIQAGETGSFTITALPAANGAGWVATLRVRVNGPLPVQFPSGQEYDLRLRDQAGQILWTWSADKLFIQALHTRDVNGFTATVEVPHPLRAPEGINYYTLEAWLTTGQDQPQFGAATALVLDSGVAPPNQAASVGRTRR